MRIGHGYDAHVLVTGRPLIIGGVNIPHAAGLAAHSDGDVLIHALCDALLGAAALGDIGQHFPDSDISNAGADSRSFLRYVSTLLKTNQYSISNVDLTLLAEEPKMAPHIPAMRKNLSADLSLDKNQINIKASTTEKMGFIGRKEGIVAFAVVLLSDNC